MNDRPRWWLIVVAASMAVIFLSQTVGMEPALLLCGTAAAAFASYRLYRSRNPAKAPAVRCLTCGETLASTARECKYCGSARWTVN